MKLGSFLNTGRYQNRNGNIDSLNNKETKKNLSKERV